MLVSYTRLQKHIPRNVAKSFITFCGSNITKYQVREDDSFMTVQAYKRSSMLALIKAKRDSTIRYKWKPSLWKQEADLLVEVLKGLR